jgi:hypothetical protein
MIPILLLEENAHLARPVQLENTLHLDLRALIHIQTVGRAMLAKKLLHHLLRLRVMDMGYYPIRIVFHVLRKGEDVELDSF